MHKVKLIQRDQYFPAPEPEGDILIKGSKTLYLHNKECRFSNNDNSIEIEITFYDFPYIDYEHDDRTLGGAFIRSLEFVCCKKIKKKNGRSNHMEHREELEKEVGHYLEYNLHRLFPETINNDGFRYTFNDVEGWLEIINPQEEKDLRETE